MERRRPPRDRGSWLRVATIVIGLVIVAYFVWTIWDYEALMAWIENARPVPFFIAMAALPAIGLPLTPFFLLAGAVFDLHIALPGTMLALVANLVFCYFVGQAALRRRLTRLFERFGYTLPDFHAETGSSLRRAVRFTATVKLAPGIPTFVKHYGLGAARVPFAVYVAVAMVISGGYAIALILVGDSLFEHELGPGTIALAVAIVLAIIVRAWSRRQSAAARAVPAR